MKPETATYHVFCIACRRTLPPRTPFVRRHGVFFHVACAEASGPQLSLALGGGKAA